MEMKRGMNNLLLHIKLICLFSSSLISSIFAAGIPVSHLHHFIESPKLSRWGEWGKLEHCPSDQVVIGMRLKVHDNQGLKDDSGLNAIKFYCQNPYSSAEYTSDIVSITSLVGAAGEWKKEFFCPVKKKPDGGKLVAVGFQLRSETSTGVKDDTAGNNLKLICSDLYQKQGFTSLEGDGTAKGDWTERQVCRPGYAICGMQTQVEVSRTIDTTGLNNLKVRCCKADALNSTSNSSSEASSKEMSGSGFQHRDGQGRTEYNPAEQELIAILDPDFHSREFGTGSKQNVSSTSDEERMVTTENSANNNNEDETLPGEIASIDQTDNSEAREGDDDVVKVVTTSYSSEGIIPQDIVNALEEEADTPAAAEGNEVEEQTASEDEEEEEETSRNFSDEDFSLYTNYKESNERTNFHMQDSEESSELEDSTHSFKDLQDEEFKSNSSPQQGQAETSRNNATVASAAASAKYSGWQWHSRGISAILIMILSVKLIH